MRVKGRPGGDEFLPIPALEQGDEDAWWVLLVVPNYEAQNSGQFIVRQGP